MKPLSILWFSSCLLVALGLCPAADEAGQIELRFVRVPATADDRTALLKLDGDKTLEVELPTTALSEPYQVPKQEAWILGKAGEDSAFVEKGRATSTASPVQVVVVIDKRDRNDGKLQLIAIDLSIKADAFAFVNASRHDISGEFGIERFGIAPKEHAQLKAETSRTDRGRRFCDVSFSYLKGEKYANFFDASWRLDEQVYGLVIFHHEAIKDKLKFTVIRDFIHSE